MESNGLEKPVHHSRTQLDSYEDFSTLRASDLRLRIDEMLHIKVNARITYLPTYNIFKPFVPLCPHHIRTPFRLNYAIWRRADNASSPTSVYTIRKSTNSSRTWHANRPNSIVSRYPSNRQRWHSARQFNAIHQSWPCRDLCNRSVCRRTMCPPRQRREHTVRWQLALITRAVRCLVVFQSTCTIRMCIQLFATRSTLTVS